MLFLLRSAHSLIIPKRLGDPARNDILKLIKFEVFDIPREKTQHKWAFRAAMSVPRNDKATSFLG